MDPREKLLRRVDLGRERGVEFGPLHNPRVTKADADITYVDHLSTDDLRRKYADNPNDAPHLHEIVEVDVVVDPAASLVSQLGASSFDFLVASHVIEHLPDPIGWLQDLGSVVRPGGHLCLVIPDRRYCFDARRADTTVAQAIDSHLRRLTHPSAHQIFDHHYGFLGDVDTMALWDGVDVADLRRTDVEDPAAFALARCRHLAETGDYEDVHCSTFTPDSFVEIVEVASHLGLADLSIVDLFPTEHGSLEFFATLQTHDGSDAARADAAATFAVVRAELRAATGDLTPMLIGPKERQLLEGKRRAVATARRAAGTMRRLVRR